MRLPVEELSYNELESSSLKSHRDIILASAQWPGNCRSELRQLGRRGLTAPKDISKAKETSSVRSVFFVVQ
jgi:hypothetical protein